MSTLFPKEFDRPWPFEIHMDEQAVPIAWRLVKIGAPVIYVQDASIRFARVSGYFELAKNGAASFRTRRRRDDLGVEYEERRVHVMSYWHGRALKVGWLSLELPRGADWPAIRYDYDGSVIIDIGRGEAQSTFY